MLAIIEGEIPIPRCCASSRAHVIRDRLFNEDRLTIEEVAAQEKLTPSSITKLLLLTFLAPEILSCIIEGEHPPALTAAN